MVVNWNLTDSKSPQVSRTLLGILADLNNAVVLMVSICSLLSESSSLFINPFGIVPSEPVTIGITTTFMFHMILQEMLSVYSTAPAAGEFQVHQLR